MRQFNFLINGTGRDLRNLSLVFLFLVITLLPFTLANKIITSPTQGLQINSWEIGTIKQNQPYTIVWDVSDSYGMLLNNTEINCFIFLQKAGTTTVLIGGSSGNASRPPGDTRSWYKSVSANNFSQTGIYNYQVDCYKLNNNSISGNLLSTFEVSNSIYPNNQTNILEPSLFIGLILMSLIMLILSYIFKNYIFAFFSGLLFLITGSYCMINGFAGTTNTWTYSLALILIGFGGIVTTLSGLDLLGSFDSNKNTGDFEDD
jgi:hypothetical protein